MGSSTLNLNGAVLAAFLVLSNGPATSAELTWTGCDSWNKELVQELSEAFFRETGHSTVPQGGNSVRGIRDVSDGLADVGCSARHKTGDPEERNAKLIPVAWDALVAIVHSENPVDRITQRNLQAVLQGRIDNWSALGGPDAPIELVVREDDDTAGLGLLLRELTFRDPDQPFPEAATRVASNEALEAKVEEGETSLAITLASRASALDVRVLNIGRLPISYDAMKGGQYPFVVPLYVVTPKAKDEATSQFVRFLKGKEGQGVLKRYGVVALSDGSKLWTRYQKQMVDARKRRSRP